MANTYRKVFTIVLIILMGAIGLFLFIPGSERTHVLIISNQENGEVYLKKEIEPFDRLTFNWIHSLEHIPWIEEYTIEEDLSITLNTIRVAAFGAGIPENKGIVSFEEGMIVMSEINEKFDHFAWIHSQTALVSIALNAIVLIQGSELPHHQKLELTIQGK